MGAGKMGAGNEGSGRMGLGADDVPLACVEGEWAEWAAGGSVTIAETCVDAWATTGVLIGTGVVSDERDSSVGDGARVW